MGWQIVCCMSRWNTCQRCIIQIADLTKASCTFNNIYKCFTRVHDEHCCGRSFCVVHWTYCSLQSYFICYSKRNKSFMMLTKWHCAWFCYLFNISLWTRSTFENASHTLDNWRGFLEQLEVRAWCLANISHSVAYPCKIIILHTLSTF